MRKRLTLLSATVLCFTPLCLVEIGAEGKETQVAPDQDGATTGKPAKVIIKKDLVYGQVHGAGLLADIAYPEGKGPFPVRVSVHGGRWVSGRL